MSAPTPRLELAYVLATDALATVRSVVASLERQTRRDLVELVLVSPAPLDAVEALAGSGLGAVREVRCPAPLSLPEARARGVRAAAAPFVFIGETHSYPEPELVEHLVTAFEGPWTAVVPTIVNANPTSAVSWAGFVLDYGAWHAARPAGEVAEPLVYNSAFRRDALLAVGERLADGLSAVDHDLWRELGAGGARSAFAPAARLRHLNVGAARWFVGERLRSGVRLGAHRARRWPLARRLAYAAASPLAALALARRARPALAAYARLARLPAGTRPWMAAAIALRTAGEALGYLGYRGLALQPRLTELEIYKERYAGDAR